MFDIRIPKRVIIRDSSLREGLDMPGMEDRLTAAEKLEMAGRIFDIGIRVFDIVHPARINTDALRLARDLQYAHNGDITVHGAVYAFSPRLEQEVSAVGDVSDEIDFIMPVTEKRKPYAPDDKIRNLLNALELAEKIGKKGNAGLANCSDADEEFVLRISREASKAGARRIILYDSIGKLDPLETFALVKKVKDASNASILYHCHNDIGLATANSLLAVYAGADCIDATINGIGDRAGNTALEQLAMIFHLKGIETGIILDKLKEVSDLVEKRTGIRIASNQPIVGDPDIIFSHISPEHQVNPEVFELFRPGWVDKG